jgi:hypothetical protein
MIHKPLLAVIFWRSLMAMAVNMWWQKRERDRIRHQDPPTPLRTTKK